MDAATEGGLSGVKILVSGDSISKGVVFDEERKKYVVSEKNYVSLIQEKINAIITNTARFGNTLIRGIVRLKNDILRVKPDIVVIEYGGNDCDFNWDEIAAAPYAEHLPQTSLSEFERTLRDTVGFVRSNGMIPVLTSLPPLEADRFIKWVSGNDPEKEKNILKWLGSVTKIYYWQERYNAAIIKAAEDTRTKWIDIRGAFLREDDYTKLICVDGIHPNEAGHRVIANRILEFISAGYEYLIRGKPCFSPA